MTTLSLSGATFRATYQITARSAEEAEARARELCVEQTVEFPLDLIEDALIRDQVVARVVGRLDTIGEGLFEAAIEFPVEIVGGELTQLLNVIFGNASLLPLIRLTGLELGEGLLHAFGGPRFGRRGLRALLGAQERPLVATALKPMGLSPVELAGLARRFAEGGIDLVKDDHGLVDQSFCPFDERVRRCAEAVAEVNARTGRRCLYFANITAPADQLLARARTAREAGAGGVVVAPGLTGLDGMARLAADVDLALPIMSHPAFQGAFTVSARSGIGHRVLFGQLNRLAGADVAIFPSYGGRFAFTEEACRELVSGTEQPMGPIEPIFPAPAGGMSLGRAPELIDFYGPEVILLIGGDLFCHGPDLVATCRRFADLVRGERP